MHPNGFRFLQKKNWTTPKVWREDGPYARYVLPGGESAEADPSLDPPRFVIPQHKGEKIDQHYPVIQVQPPSVEAEVTVNYYFEFDTTPTFDSPNYWRYPTLNRERFSKQMRAPPNVTGRDGYSFRLFQTWQHEVDSTQPSMRFPFRVTAMRLPEEWDALDFDQLTTQAAALASGLDDDKLIEEVFAYVRQNYLHANDHGSASAMDVFTRGLGQCGAVYNFAGTLLELNGIRFRLVGAFSPRDRLIRQQSNSGHSIAEVYHPDLKEWSFFDPYLDFYFPGISAAELDEHPYAQQTYFAAFKGREREHGEGVTLAEFFSYRTYRDRRQRLPNTNMLQLDGREDQYGLTWPLEVDEQTYAPSECFPKTIRVYVRCRYLLSDGPTVRYRRDILTPQEKRALMSSNYRLSPWAVTSIEIPAREMMQTAEN